MRQLIIRRPDLAVETTLSDGDAQFASEPPGELTGQGPAATARRRNPNGARLHRCCAQSVDSDAVLQEKTEELEGCASTSATARSEYAVEDAASPM